MTAPFIDTKGFSHVAGHGSCNQRNGSLPAPQWDRRSRSALPVRRRCGGTTIPPATTTTPPPGHESGGTRGESGKQRTGREFQRLRENLQGAGFLGARRATMPTPSIVVGEI